MNALQTDFSLVHAGGKAQEQKDVTEAQAGNTADHAAVKAGNAQAGMEHKKDDAKLQASAAGVRPRGLELPDCVSCMASSPAMLSTGRTDYIVIKANVSCQRCRV